MLCCCWGGLQKGLDSSAEVAESCYQVWLREMFGSWWHTGVSAGLVWGGMKAMASCGPWRCGCQAHPGGLCLCSPAWEIQCLQLCWQLCWPGLLSPPTSCLPCWKTHGFGLGELMFKELGCPPPGVLSPDPTWNSGSCLASPNSPTWLPARSLIQALEELRGEHCQLVSRVRGVGFVEPGGEAGGPTWPCGVNRVAAVSCPRRC